MMQLLLGIIAVGVECGAGWVTVTGHRSVLRLVTFCDELDWSIDECGKK
jgi:hypothetical protein